MNVPADENVQKLKGDWEGPATNVVDILELLHQPLYYADRQGIIVRASAALAVLTGYAPAELRGKPLASLFTDMADVRRLAQETLEKGKVDSEAVILTKDYKTVPVGVSMYLIRDDAGNVAGHAAVLNSLVERQTQARIEQAAREWRATMDAITDMVWISDRDCQLVRVNRAYAAAASMEPKLLIGKPCQGVSSWAKDFCARCPHKQTLATKESATGEFLDPQKGTCLEISTSPIFDANGEVAASVCIARDVTERKQAEKQIQSLSRLRQYFSPRMAQRLISDEDIYKVRRKDLTIFFIDIRGFTSLSDNTEPEELLTMLNEYFTEMTKIIFDYGGTVCKFIGDGIMGFFGDLEEHQNHAELAVKMALEMQSKVKAMNQTSVLWSDSPLAIGIGIDTGYVTIGHVGPENHRDYTIIGRHVNLSARLESEAKPGQVLVSQRTYRTVMSLVKAQEIGHIEVKGFDKPVLAYSILGLA